jgi:hypothetical protein
MLRIYTFVLQSITMTLGSTYSLANASLCLLNLFDLLNLQNFESNFCSSHIMYNVRSYNNSIKPTLTLILPHFWLFYCPSYCLFLCSLLLIVPLNTNPYHRLPHVCMTHFMCTTSSKSWFWHMLLISTLYSSALLTTCVCKSLTLVENSQITCPATISLASLCPMHLRDE